MGSEILGFGKALMKLATDEGVADRVFIRPPVRPHEVVGVAGQADVGLILNHHVGLNNYLSLPNKIFESVAAGLPVVTSDFPDMAELVRTYEVGETCDPEDPEDIARAIRAVVMEPERHRRLRENARKAAPELSWERSPSSSSAGSGSSPGLDSGLDGRGHPVAEAGPAPLATHLLVGRGSSPAATLRSAATIWPRSAGSTAAPAPPSRTIWAAAVSGRDTARIGTPAPMYSDSFMLASWRRGPVTIRAASALRCSPATTSGEACRGSGSRPARHRLRTASAPAR